MFNYAALQYQFWESQSWIHQFRQLRLDHFNLVSNYHCLDMVTELCSTMRHACWATSCCATPQYCWAAGCCTEGSLNTKCDWCRYDFVYALKDAEYMVAGLFPLVVYVLVALVSAGLFIAVVTHGVS